MVTYWVFGTDRHCQPGSGSNRPGLGFVMEGSDMDSGLSVNRGHSLHDGTGLQPCTPHLLVPLVLTKAEVASLLRVSPKTVYNMAKNGEFRTIRYGKKKTLYPYADIRAWVERNAELPTSPKPVAKQVGQ